MTDVVAVALISAGSSLLGASVGALTTYKVSMRNAETTIATSAAQKEVELAKIKAENTRLRDQHQEEERRNRQATYHRVLTALQRIHGIRIDSEDLQDVMSEWRDSRSGVQIFGSREAFQALDGVQSVLKERPEDEAEDLLTAWQHDLKEAVYKFIEAVRSDVRADLERSARTRD